MCENGGFSLSGSHIINTFTLFHTENNTHQRLKALLICQPDNQVFHQILSQHCT